MKNLSVEYLGLQLRNPLIVSSSGLTSTVRQIAEWEKAGAGAVVVKSLFEEQIDGEATSLNYYSDYPEAADYLAEYTRSHSLDQHMELIAGAKKAVSIPVIASIHCAMAGGWTSFAKQIEAAGADALELNIYILPVAGDSDGAAVEKRYFEIVSKVCKAVSIPVSVKIGYNFSNIPAVVKELYYRGVKGVTMFNRFYEPDFDVDRLTAVSSDVFSRPGELHRVLRWLAITSASVTGPDYSASTGIHGGEALVKVLLAGAATGQLCTALYQNRSAIGGMLEYLSHWMSAHGFFRVEDFVGRMNYTNLPDPAAYERTQFMKYFSMHE